MGSGGRPMLAHRKTFPTARAGHSGWNPRSGVGLLIIPCLCSSRAWISHLWGMQGKGPLSGEEAGTAVLHRLFQLCPPDPVILHGHHAGRGGNVSDCTPTFVRPPLVAFQVCSELSLAMPLQCRSGHSPLALGKWRLRRAW